MRRGVMCVATLAVSVVTAALLSGGGGGLSGVAVIGPTARALLFVAAGGVDPAGPPGAPAGLPQPGPARPGEEGRRSLTDRVISELALSEAQTAQVKDLDRQRRERLDAAGDDGEKRREVTEWFHAEVRKVLTAEQAPKFDAMVRRGRPSGEDFVSRLRRQLNLTDKQVEDMAALKPLLDKRLAEAGTDVPKRREAWQWYQKEVLALLTPEQQRQFDESAAELRQRAEAAGLVRMEWALRGIAVTPEQERQIVDLRKQRDEKVKAAYEAYKEALKGVLTAEQMARFEQNLKTAPRLGEGPRGARAGGSQPPGQRPRDRQRRGGAAE